MMQPPTVPAATPDQDDFSSPGEETFAKALALMTAHAQAAAAERVVLAQAVSAQLAKIACVACTSAECRLALSVLAAHWAAMSDPAVNLEGDIALWHVAPAFIQ